MLSVEAIHIARNSRARGATAASEAFGPWGEGDATAGTAPIAATKAPALAAPESVTNERRER